MTTHTAGKLTASLKWDSGNPRSHPSLLDEHGAVIAELSSVRPTTEQDAEHLARCWNSYPDLVAIQAAASAFDHEVGDAYINGFNPHLKALALALRAALTAARGE